MDAGGCPSGLDPAVDDTGTVADPAAFVWSDETGAAHLDLMVSGAHCAGCIAKIEGAMRALPGMRDARLNLSTQRLRLTFDAAVLTPDTPVARLAALGYGARPFDAKTLEGEADTHSQYLVRCLAVAGFAAMNVMLFSVPIWAGAGQEMEATTRSLFLWISAVIAIPAALYAGRPFFTSAWGALRTGHANMEVPISLAIVLALSMSLYETAIGGGHAYFDGVVSLEFFLLIGRYLDHRLRARAREAARDLMRLQATSAQVRGADGRVTSVPARAVQPGDHVLLAPGERAPVDGVIIEGASSLDRSLATGETAPVLTQVGMMVEAGVINLDHPLVIRATARAEQSFLAELARLMEAGQQTKSQFMRMADRAAALYVPVVHTGAALTLGVWWLVLHAPFHTALMYATALLIITCPCAMGLAAPAVQIVATGRLFKAGVFVRAGDALERLDGITAVVFDKTGTLTVGEATLVNASTIAPDDLVLAAALARASRHPLARALVRVAGPGAVADAVTEVRGAGLQAQIDGQVIRLGSHAFAAPDAVNPDDDYSALWLAVPGRHPVRFAFTDAVRPDAADVVKTLINRGLHVELLSGDADGPVAQVAQAVGIPHAQARVTPAGKLDRLTALKADGHRVLMIGDGLNDAPALSAAHASMAPSSGADIAQSAADLVFRGQALHPVLEAMTVARRSKHRMLENFGFSALYNIVAASLAVTGQVTPLIAAIAMSSSSLIVMLNALRLRAAR